MMGGREEGGVRGGGWGVGGEKGRREQRKGCKRGRMRREGEVALAGGRERWVRW